MMKPLKSYAWLIIASPNAAGIS